MKSWGTGSDGEWVMQPLEASLGLRVSRLKWHKQKSRVDLISRHTTALLTLVLSLMLYFSIPLLSVYATVMLAQPCTCHEVSHDIFKH